MPDSPKISPAPPRRSGRAFAKVNEAKVNGPHIRPAHVAVPKPRRIQPNPAQLDAIEALLHMDQRELGIFAAFARGRKHPKDIDSLPAPAQWRALFLRERDDKDRSNEGHMRIVVSWPVITTAKGRPACREFPDCPHPGCLTQLDTMRVSARILLESDSPLSSDMRVLCVAIVTKTLTRHHRVMAQRAADVLETA